MIFQEYFNKFAYYKSKRRGFSVYDCNDQYVNSFIQIANENKVKF